MSLVQQLYDRTCSIKVYGIVEVPAGPNGQGITTSPASVTFSSKQDDGSPGFRIKFTVKAVSATTPKANDAVMQIYNLGASSRKIVGQLNNVIELYAGYGSTPKLLFRGNIHYTVTKKVGADYVTEIHAMDGLFAHNNALVNQSFAQSTTASQMINSLSGILQGAGVQVGQISSIPNKIYNQGVVMSGKVVDELQKVCDANGLNWTIEKGKLNIVPIGDALKKPIVILSPSTGLIGIPEQREIDINEASLISFKCLLNADLEKYCLITLVSKFVNGIYTIASLTHTGDTFGVEWYTEGEAT